MPSVSQSVCLLVGKKGKKRVYSGRLVKRKRREERRKLKALQIQENAKTLGVVQSTPPHTSPTKNVVP